MDTSNDYPLTDEKSWKKHPQRLEPILQANVVSGQIITLGVLSVFAMLPMIFIIFPMIRSANVNLITCGSLLPWYAIIGFMAYAVGWKAITGLIGGRKFKQSRTQTKAHILRRQMIQHTDNYGHKTDFFLLQLEFTPFRADSIGAIRLVASVSNTLYDSLLNSETVNITYGTQDPRFFLIEGE